MTENGSISPDDDPVYIEPVSDENEINEEVLRMVDALKLDREKTIQVSSDTDYSQLSLLQTPSGPEFCVRISESP